MLGLVPEEPGGVDVQLDLSLRRGGVVLDAPVLLEEVRGDFVDRDVGGLGGEHDGHQQLPIAAEVQHDVGVRILAAQAADDL